MAKAVNATSGPSAANVVELMKGIREIDHMIKGIRWVWILTEYDGVEQAPNK
jgi:hypothetical protein